MSTTRPTAKRLTIATGLAGLVLASAALQAPVARASSGPPAALPVATVVAGPSGATGVGSGAIVGAIGAMPSAGEPSLSTVNVQAGGTEAILTFTSSEPTSAAVAVSPVGPISTVPTEAPTGTLHAPVSAITGVQAPVAVTNAGPDASAPVFVTSHQVHLTNLKSNTAYDATVSAQTKGGTGLSQHVTFQTAKLRVAITLETIDVTNGAAWFGDNTINWDLGLTWGPQTGAIRPPSARGQTATCFPTNGYSPGAVCQDGSYGDGTFHPYRPDKKLLTWVFAEENFDFFPQVFTVGASAQQDDIFSDSLIGGAFPHGCAGDGSDTWTIPQGVDTAQRYLFTCGNDESSGFESQLFFYATLFYSNDNYPAPQRNRPTDPWSP